MARRKKLPPERFELFPDYKPKCNDAGAISGAVYFISNHGVVWRVDSSVEYDPKNPTFDIAITPAVKGITLNVKLAGGSVTRSLPAAIAAAFATVECPATDVIYGQWAALIHPDAPKIDGVSRCSVVDIVWTPYSETTFWSRGTRLPKTELMLPIV